MSESIKIIFQFSLAFILLPCVLTGCAQAQKTINLSTDKAVFERLEKVQNKKFSQDMICIERIKELAEVIIIGSARYDYECNFEGVFVKTIYYENGADLSKTVLNVFGWEKLTRELREKTALVWVEKVLLAFSTVLYTQDKDFKGGVFNVPQITTTENGEIVITLWTSVMRRKKEFQRHEFKFAADGSFLEK